MAEEQDKKEKPKAQLIKHRKPSGEPEKKGAAEKAEKKKVVVVKKKPTKKPVAKVVAKKDSPPEEAASSRSRDTAPREDRSGRSPAIQPSVRESQDLRPLPRRQGEDGNAGSTPGRAGYDRDGRPQTSRPGYDRGPRPQGDRGGYNRGPQSDRGGYNRGIVQNIGTQGHTDFSFTVHRDDYANAMQHAQPIADAVSAKSVVGANDIGKLSVVGIGMKSHAGIASKMFGTLSDNDINIQMISTSEIRISVVIAEHQLERAVNALHDAFELHATAVNEEV